MFKNLIIAFVLACFIMSSGYIYLEKTVVKELPVVKSTEVLYCRAIAISARQLIGIDMTRQAIEKNYKTFENCNVLLGHDGADPDKIVGKILSSKLKFKDKVEYIEVIFKIITKDAIEKVKLGQYDFLSVGMQNVRTVELSENNARMLDFEGIEISFVGSPRDKWAEIIEYSENIEDVSK